MTQPIVLPATNVLYFFPPLKKKSKGCLPGSVGEACDSYLRIVSLSPKLGMELTERKKERKTLFSSHLEMRFWQVQWCILKHWIHVGTGCIPSQVLEFSINNGLTPKQRQMIIYQMTYGKLKVGLLPSLSRKMILHVL